MRTTRTTRALLGTALMAVSAIGLGAATSGGANRAAVPQGIGTAPVPGTIVFECFELDRGPDPNAVVRTQTKNFGFDTLIVRRAVRMCEPALKLPTQPADGTIEMEPNVTMTLGTASDPGMVSLDGALGLLRESPSLPSRGMVLGASLQGGGNVAVDSFFDVFTELDAVGNYEIDSFFDITYRIDSEGGGGTTQMQLKHESGDLYTGLLLPAVQIGGVELTHATMKINTPGTIATRVMECFRTQRGSDPDDPYALVTRNFGPDKVIVRQSRVLCEGAIKSKEPPQPGTAWPVGPVPIVWECFAIAEGDRPNRAFNVYTHNFGRHEIRVVRAVELCEDARKVRIDAAGNETSVGTPSGRVYECYEIKGRNPAAGYWLTTRNFGPGAVRVRHPEMMCEQAYKIPQYSFTGPPTPN